MATPAPSVQVVQLSLVYIARCLVNGKQYVGGHLAWASGAATEAWRGLRRVRCCAFTGRREAEDPRAQSRSSVRLRLPRRTPRTRCNTPMKHRC